jgi:hypothetical protein
MKPSPVYSYIGVHEKAYFDYIQVIPHIKKLITLKMIAQFETKNTNQKWIK